MKFSIKDILALTIAVAIAVLILQTHNTDAQKKSDFNQLMKSLMEKSLALEEKRGQTIIPIPIPTSGVEQKFNH